MQSNEGFPGDTDLLTRKVNEYEGQHRFGGGTDFDCDPHVMDMLGDQAQLADYKCEADGSTAWLDDDKDTARLLTAMRAGRELVVEGTSNRGTRTVDRYSLYGFTAAHRAIGKACPAR